MNAEQLENLVEQTLGKIRSFVQSFVKKDEAKISSKLDALVMEKAKEQGMEIKLKNPLIVFKYFGIAFGSVAFLSLLYVVVFFVPGPWVRFIAKPQVMSMQLSNVNFSMNGVSANSQKIEIVSPKAIKGQQFIAANLIVSPKTSYEVSLEENNTKIVITPKQDLAEGTNYTVSIKPGVLFNDGTYLANEQSWVVPTKAVFDVVSISPRDGAVAAKNVAFEVSFSTDEFDLETAKKAISIFPAIEGKYEKIGSRVVFVPQKALQVGGAYTLIVSSEMKNTAGKAISKEFRSTFTISVEEESKVVAPAFRMQYSPVVNASTGQFSSQVNADNVKKISVAYYKVTWADIQPYINEYMQKGVLNPAPLLSKLQPEATSTQNADYEGSSTMFTVSYEKLGDGIHVTKITNSSDSQMQIFTVVFKSMLGVYASNRDKLTDADVWAFDYGTLAPAKDVKITAVGCTKDACTSVDQTTPENGNVSVKTDRAITYLLAEKGGNTALLYAGQRDNYFSTFNAAMTDRSVLAKVIPNKPSYFPGDMYKYSVLLRQKNNGVYNKLDSNASFVVALCPTNDWNTGGFVLDSNDITSHCLSIKEMKSNGDSQLSDSVQLWKRLESLQLVVAQKTSKGLNVVATEYILISEQDRPQAETSVNFDKKLYIGKTTATVTGRLTNMSGAGIAGRSGTVSLSFNAVDRGKSDDPDGMSVQITTDSSGNFKATFSLPITNALQYEYNLITTVAIKDGENTISSTDNSLWTHGESLEKTLTNKGGDAYYIPVGASPVVNLKLTQSGNKQPINGRKVTINVTRQYTVTSLGEYYYDEASRTTKQRTVYDTRTEQVQKMENAVFSDKGEYSFELKSVKEGSYQMQIIDSSGDWVVRDNRDLFWTTGMADDALSKVNEWIHRVSFEKDSATVGEKVTLSIDGSFTKTKEQIAMIFKTNSVIDWRYISQDTSKIEIPITEAMVGGLQVCLVHPMKGMIPNDNSATFAGYGINDVCTSILVENKEKELKLELTPEKQTIQPGKESALSVAVNDSQNKGTKALLGITVVDKAVYTADGYDSEEDRLNLYRDIYQQFSNYADASYSSINIHDILNESGGMGGAGGEEKGVRKNFDENTYWNAQIYTDGNGKASINVPYNDGITTWVVTVWAVTDDFKVGSKVIEVNSSKDVYVDLDKPQFVRVGDTWKPYVRVVNTQNKSFSGTLELSCDGCLDKTVSFPVAIQAYSSADVQVDSKVTKQGQLPFNVKLTQNGQFVDGLTYQINARPIGYVEPFSHISSVSKSQKDVKLTVPQNGKPEFGNYYIAIGRLPFVGGLDLNIEPANSTTEEVSAALLSLATVAQHKAYGASQLSEDEVLRSAQYYVAELQLRMLSDGSFPALQSGGEDQQSSIAAARALAAAISAFGSKLYVSSNLQSLLVSYQQKLLLGEAANLETKSSAAYSLSLVSKKDAAPLVTALLKSTDLSKASTDQLAYLASALYQIGATADAGTVTQKLAEQKKDSTGTLYIPAKDSLVTTAMISFLYKNLGYTSVKKDEFQKYQQWVINQCSSCYSKMSSITALSLLSDSYIDEQLGSAKQEEVTISVNGKEITKVFYNGALALFELPPTEMKQDNTITISSPSGRPLFAALTGTFYKTSVTTTQDPAYKVEVSYNGLSGSRQVKLGQHGYVRVVVTAQEDVMPTNIGVYLPTGLRLIYGDWSNELSAEYRAGAWSAYGNASQSDLNEVWLPSMKKGERKVVIVPFMAVRQGSFNGEVVRVVSVNGKGSTLQGNTVGVN